MMGAKTTRLARLKASDPTCYSCGIRPTETEDHVPSRECFVDRIGPEGFGFPACKTCNNSAGPLEQVVALYLHMANFSATVSDKQLRRLAQGVNNNNPGFMPKIEMRANLARRHFREKKMALPEGLAFADQPIATLPPGHQIAFELFARRLTCALFYKETKQPLPQEFFIAVAWMPWSEGSEDNAAGNATNLFPALTMSNRTNTDIGDQFSYRWGMHPEGSIFGFVAKFSEAYYIFGAAAAASLHAQRSGAGVRWKPHSTDLEKS
jgi:hypothetical protein